MQIPTIGDPEEATGDYLSGIVGVRIATPFFGTGFNFCIGRHPELAWACVQKSVYASLGHYGKRSAVSGADHKIGHLCAPLCM